MDKSDWDTAISYFEMVTGTLSTDRTFLNNKAGAYAGKCGLVFIDYFGDLGSIDLTGTTIFKFLMGSVKNYTTSHSYCHLAEQTMISIGLTAADRTSQENLFMLVLSMFKVGAYLKDYLDANPAPADGVAKAGINLCTIGAVGSTGDSAIPSAEMKEIASGWSHFINNFSAFPSFPAAVQAAMTALTGSICSFLETGGTSANPCELYDATNGKTGYVTAEFEEAVNTVRDMLKTGPTSAVAQVGVQEVADAPCNPPLPVDAGTATTFRACCAFAGGAP